MCFGPDAHPALFSVRIPTTLSLNATASAALSVRRGHHMVLVVEGLGGGVEQAHTKGWVAPTRPR